MPGEAGARSLARRSQEALPAPQFGSGQWRSARHHHQGSPPARRRDRAGIRSRRVLSLLRRDPAAEADHVPELRLRAVRIRAGVANRLSRRRSISKKRLASASAGPAHEPGGEGGGPPGSLLNPVAGHTASSSRTSSALDVPLLSRCPPFAAGKLGSQQSTRKCRTGIRGRAGATLE